MTALPFQNQSSRKKRFSEAEEKKEVVQVASPMAIQGEVERRERNEENADFSHGVFHALPDAFCL